MQMMEKLLGLHSIKFSEQNLYINKKSISYNDIDCFIINVPKKGMDYSKVYSSTHFITVFTTIDIPIKIAVDLSTNESKQLIENVKKHIKDYIIDNYELEIFVTD